jgi:CRISPR-associated protein Cas1
VPDRILDLSEEPAHVSLRHGLLVLKRPTVGETTLPVGEIAVVVASQPQLSFTLGALSSLCSAGAAVVVCGDDRLPTGMMLPLQGHTTQVERMAAQVAAKLPVKKRLWQSLVAAKLRSQAAALRLETGGDAGLNEIARTVRSGDPDNREAYGARRYWLSLMGDDFVRDRDAADVNRVLNYGYTVLRAMTGRAICAAGLHPSLGVHHHNRYSQFCLADDLMEPFRPVVDRAAVAIRRTWGADAPLDRTVKTELLNCLNHRYRVRNERRQLFDVVARLTSSLAGVYMGQRTTLELPDFDDFYDDQSVEPPF